jgi:hypothetical protein
VERERLHEGAVATRTVINAKRAVAGENEREIAFALTSMTNRFLHMGTSSRRISDIWQAIQGKKCKTKSIPSQKCKKASFFVRVASQQVPLQICRNFALSALPELWKRQTRSKWQAGAEVPRAPKVRDSDRQPSDYARI